jgi:hypothetical protein
VEIAQSVEELMMARVVDRHAVLPFSSDSTLEDRARKRRLQVLIAAQEPTPYRDQIETNFPALG